MKEQTVQKIYVLAYLTVRIYFQTVENQLAVTVINI